MYTARKKGKLGRDRRRIQSHVCGTASAYLALLFDFAPDPFQEIYLTFFYQCRVYAMDLRYSKSIIFSRSTNTVQPGQLFGIRKSK